MTTEMSLFQRVALQAEKIRSGYLTNPRATMNIVVEVAGPLDLAALDAALGDLVTRNETLRTRPLTDQDAVELVATGDIACTPVPATGHAEDDLARMAAVVGNATIDVHSPPLVRCFRLSSTPHRHLVGLVFHHFAVDPTSLRHAVAELAVLYTARLTGAAVAPPALRYTEYARWQAARLAARSETDHAAWQHALNGVSPTRYRRAIPFEQGRPVDGRVLRAELLSAPEVDAVLSWSRRHRSTVFTTMFAAYALALRSSADSDELILATTFEQRDHPGARHLIGPFVYPTLLPLRTRAGEPWHDWLTRVRSAVIDVYQRAQFPLLDLFAKAPQLVPGALGAEPTWFRMFEYLPSHDIARYRFGEATGQVVHSAGSQESQNLFGVFLRVRRTPQGCLVGRIAYDANDVTDAEVRELLAEFRGHLTLSLIHT